MTCPRSASTSTACEALSRLPAWASSRSGSSSPATIASRIARPLCPSTSLTTPVSLMFASSSTFWIRWTCWARSRTSCLRARVRSRRARIGVGGTRLPRISPWASRSAIQVASFMSLLRPGMFRMCIALANTSSNRPSKTCQTGFQYTPLDSIATCVHPCCSSQSASRNNSWVVVPKRSSVRWTRGPSACRAQATTLAGCTSNPAHRAYMTSITPPDGGATAQSPQYANSRRRAPGAARPWQQSGVLVGLRVQLAHGLPAPLTTTTSVPACRLKPVSWPRGSAGRVKN